MGVWKELQLKEDKYTDAEAVSAVATNDDYVKNTGDTITGTLVSTKLGDGGGFDVQDFYNTFRVKSGGEWFGWYGRKNNGTFLAWFGGHEAAENKGELNYYLYNNGLNARVNLIIHYDFVKVSRNFYISVIKSGSTQANASAAADEVWKTSGHANLPDNVLMIGV